MREGKRRSGFEGEEKERSEGRETWEGKTEGIREVEVEDDKWIANDALSAK